MGRIGAWLLLAIAGVALMSPWRLRLQPVATPRPMAVIFVGPNSVDFADSGLAAELSRSPQAWTGADLALIPGANEGSLWRRLETGVLGARNELPSLLAAYHIEIFGSWSSLASSEVDEEVLRAAAAHDDQPAVVILNCARTPLGLSDESCRNCFRRAVELLRGRAQDGETGLLLSVPPHGFPEVGAIWVTGPHLKDAPRFRFREIDLTPTMLYLSGNAIPSVVAGVPGLDLIDGEYMFHHPIRYVGGGR